MGPGKVLEREYINDKIRNAVNIAGKNLHPLPYINLPSGNGGIVLDVSEEEGRFRSLAPVELSGPIEFSFTAQSNLVSWHRRNWCGWMEAKKLGWL